MFKKQTKKKKQLYTFECFIFMKSTKLIEEADRELVEGRAVPACNKFVFLLPALSACY